MRWDELFDDLAAQGRAAGDAELAAEVADRSRWQSGQIRLLDRVSAAVGRAVDMLLEDGTGLSGTVVATGDGWLGVRDRSGDALVPRHGVARLAFRVPDAEAPASSSGAPAVPQRAGLVQVARWLARDRAYVRLHVRGGRQLAGTVDRAGADHLELAEHEPDEARRRAAVRAVALVPFAAVLLVRGNEVRWLD